MKKNDLPKAQDNSQKLDEQWHQKIEELKTIEADIVQGKTKLPSDAESLKKFEQAMQDHARQLADTLSAIVVQKKFLTTPE
jgi:ribosomal protein L10